MDPETKIPFLVYNTSLSHVEGHHENKCRIIQLFLEANGSVKPLLRNYRQKFSAVLDDAPAEIRDYSVIVTEVDTVNVVIQERKRVF